MPTALCRGGRRRVDAPFHQWDGLGGRLGRNLELFERGGLRPRDVPRGGRGRNDSPLAGRPEWTGETSGVDQRLDGCRLRKRVFCRLRNGGNSADLQRHDFLDRPGCRHPGGPARGGVRRWNLPGGGQGSDDCAVGRYDRRAACFPSDERGFGRRSGGPGLRGREVCGGWGGRLHFYLRFGNFLGSAEFHLHPKLERDRLWS